MVVTHTDRCVGTPKRKVDPAHSGDTGMVTHRRPVIIGTLLVAILAATPLFAQPVRPSIPTGPTGEVNERWAPWLGCWELVDEDAGSAFMRDLTEVLERAAQRRPRRPVGDVEVCVAPDADRGGVTLTTTVVGKPVLQESIAADGIERPFTESDCRGRQRAEWSANRQRIFSRAELTCTGQAPRTVSGFAMMESTDTWLDIQVVEIGGRASTRVRRYRPSPARAGATRSADAGMAASPLTTQDVIEASAKLPARAVEAALIETDARFILNGRRLIELDAAGVADEVTDLMVALSFRDQFIVDRGVRGGGYSTGSAWADPYLWSYYYAPFAYPHLGYYDPYYYNGPGYVIIDPGPSQPVGPQPGGTGRVVDGRGYTRVRPREPVRVEAGGRSTKSGTSDPSGGSSSSGGSSGGASPQGYSGGGSSGGCGRTAQPRPPR